jgi:hypothetical protein
LPFSASSSVVPQRSEGILNGLEIVRLVADEESSAAALTLDTVYEPAPSS